MSEPAPAAKNGFNFKTMSSDHKLMLASSLSVCVAAILVVLKAITLMASGSLSIMASLTDSGLDLLASLVTFFAFRYAKVPPDKEHTFGHGKAEAFSALIQAGLVFASAAIIMQQCLSHVLHPNPIRQSGWAIVVLLVSIVLTLGLVMFQTMAIKGAGSVAISADRMHYIADLVSNVVAVIGVVAASFGFLAMDSLAGFVIAVWFVWGAVQVLREASVHLMDRAMDDKDVERIGSLVESDANILGLHQLRTRMSGPYILIQMHVELDPCLNLIEAHKIIIHAEDRLLKAYPNADIIIHPDPKGEAGQHGGVFQKVVDFEEPATDGTSESPDDSRRAPQGRS